MGSRGRKMKKRVLSFALALSMVFGCFSYSEQSAVSESTQITASAASIPASLTYRKYEGNVVSKKPAYIIITGYTGSLSELVIPDKIDGLPVAEIDPGSFKEAPNLKKVTLPKKLVSYSGAFADCKSIETVVIPEGVFVLDDQAFIDCPKLKNIKLPGTIEYIGHSAFSGCTSLTSVNIPSKVVNIRSGAFARSGLKSISVPSNVKIIGSAAFQECASLTSVTLAKGLREIGENAFIRCTSLKSITIPEGTTTISKGAFDRCTALTSVSLPGTLTKMEHCFDEVPWYTEQEKKSRANNKGLVILGSVLYDAQSYTGISLALPSSIKYISSYSKFKSTLKTIKLNEGLQGIGTDALAGSGISMLNLPASLTYIDTTGFVPSKTVVTVASGNKSFVVDDNILYNKDKTILYHCPSGYAPTKALPSGLLTIQAGAFEDNTKLTALTLPVTVQSIEKNAFNNCTALKRLTVPAGTSYIGYHAFGYNKSGPGTVVKNNNFVCYGYNGSEAKRECTNDGIAFKEIAACAHSTTFTTTETKKINKCVTHNVKKTICMTCGKVVDNPSTTQNTHELLANHVFSSSCVDDGYNVRVCAACGEEVWEQTKPAGHKFNGGTVTVTMPGKTFGEAVRTMSCTVCGKKSERYVSIDRLYGADRYKTAVSISSIYPFADAVVLAQGAEFADALAGVPFAQNIGAPILLTGKDSIAPEVLNEIKRLKASKVYVLGGEGAISQKVVDPVIKLGIKKENIVRLAGKTRFGTAAAIASKSSGIPKEIFFVYGFNFADALSVSPVAARKKAPIIYLPTNGGVDAETMAYLKTVKGHITDAYVIGGSGVISDSMLTKAAQAVGLKTAQRVWGENRYETCTAVNTTFKSAFSGNGICVATGMTFPDALAGGVFAADSLSPMFLADGTLSADQKKFLAAFKTRNMYILGGKGAVPDKLGEEIARSIV